MSQCTGMPLPPHTPHTPSVKNQSCRTVSDGTTSLCLPEQGPPRWGELEGESGCWLHRAGSGSVFLCALSRGEAGCTSVWQRCRETVLSAWCWGEVGLMEGKSGLQ